MLAETPAPPAHVGNNATDDPEIAHISGGRHHTIAHRLRRASHEAVSCPACRAELEAEVEIIRALRALGVDLRGATPQPDAWDRLRARIATTPPRPVRPQPPLTRWATTATPLLTSCAALLLAVTLAGPQPASPPAAALLSVGAMAASQRPSPPAETPLSGGADVAAKDAQGGAGVGDALRYRRGPLPDGLHLSISVGDASAPEPHQPIRR